LNFHKIPSFFGWGGAPSDGVVTHAAEFFRNLFTRHMAR
jgi:hypothetical protein